MITLRKKAIALAAAGLVAIGLSGCSVPFSSPTPIFRVNGTCTTKKGTLHGVGSGFSASVTYQTIVTRPDGSNYDLSPDVRFNNTSQYGTIDYGVWNWPCNGDPSGTYSLTIKDLSNNATAKTKFTIG